MKTLTLVYFSGFTCGMGLTLLTLAWVNKSSGIILLMPLGMIIIGLACGIAADRTIAKSKCVPLSTP